ncbi:MAG: NAD(P)H-dependent oxidoreductase subunit E [Legionellales bacterium]|nr:NAD(P)H-dependent oxidoreductase subunit E [Legionellales bacterium]
MMAYYTKHLFFCVNLREGGKACCQLHDAENICAYAKQEIKSRLPAGAGGIRVSKSGCLGRCQEGPSLVIYPEGTWYRYANRQDIDEIIQEHLINGNLVTRLLMPVQQVPEQKG